MSRRIVIEGGFDDAFYDFIRAAAASAPDLKLRVYLRRLGGADPALSDLVDLVAARVDIRRAVIEGPYRGAGAVYARHLIIWAGHHILGAHLKAIAGVLNRDKSTISWALSRATAWFAEDSVFQADARAIAYMQDQLA